MKRTFLIMAVSLAALLAAAPLASAQNPKASVDVHVKSETKGPLKGVIEKETIQGVKLSTRPAVVPATDIDDIDYSGQLEATVAISYKAGRNAEQKIDAAKSVKDRADQINSALANYRGALAKTKPPLDLARRHMEFKIAYLDGLLALDGGKKESRSQAIAGLEKFKDANKDSWQYSRAMLLLARMQAAEGNFKAVQASVKELVGSAALAPAKQAARLLLLELLVQGKEYNEAQKLARDLIAELPKNSPDAVKARLAEASCLAATGDDMKPAITKLREILNEVKDKKLKAITYNTLGECYYRAAAKSGEKGPLEEARWQFLWVDTVYNDDRVQHAKALYYLWRIFSDFNQDERAQEFYEALTNSPQFAGLDYQRRAQNEAKKKTQ
jgi:hypothetical protein